MTSLRGAGRRSNLEALAGLCLAVVLAVASFGSVAQSKLAIVTTSADLKSFADVVGGERVEVASLAAPEHDPHTFEIKPAQLARARSADLVIRVGLDHEPWFARLQLPSRVPVLDASRNVRLIQTETPRLRVERAAHVHAFGNTHYWLDPENAIAISMAVRDALTKLRPADAAFFAANARAFGDAVANKAAAWRRILAPFRGARVVVMHDSFSYLAQFFGLQLVAAAEPHPGVPPSPAELAALVQRMRESRVRVLVAEPHSNASLARRIAGETGARVVTLHASGHDYLRLMDANVNALAAALKAGQ